MRDTLLTQGGEIVNARLREIYQVARLCRPNLKEEWMPADFISSLFVFILSAFLGFELIKRVSPLAAHAADVADQRARRHRRGRRHHHCRAATRRGCPPSSASSPSPPPSATWSAASSSPTACCSMFKTGKARKSHEPGMTSSSSSTSPTSRGHRFHPGAQVAELAGLGHARRAHRRNCLGHRRRWPPSSIRKSATTNGSSSRSSSAPALAFPSAW